MERPLNPKSLSSLLGQAIVWRAKWSHLVISCSDISPRGEAVCLSPQFRHLSYKFTKLRDFWTMPAVREPFPWHFPHNLIWKEKIKLSPIQNCQPNALEEFDRKRKGKKKQPTLQALRWRNHLYLCIKEDIKRQTMTRGIDQTMNMDRTNHGDFSSQKDGLKWRLNSLSFLITNFWVMLILGRKFRLHLNGDQPGWVC